MKDVFAIQDEISLSIVEALKVNLLQEEEKAITKKYTRNVGAYESYMMGKYYFGRWDFENALYQLDLAIEKVRTLP